MMHHLCFQKIKAKINHISLTQVHKKMSRPFNDSIYFLVPKINNQAEYDDRRTELQTMINKEIGLQWRLTGDFNQPTDFSIPPHVFQKIPEPIFETTENNYKTVAFEEGSVPKYSEQSLLKIKFVGTQYLSVAVGDELLNDMDTFMRVAKQTVNQVCKHHWNITERWALFDDFHTVFPGQNKIVINPLDMNSTSKNNIMVEIISHETNQYWLNTPLYLMNAADLQMMTNFQMSTSWRINKLACDSNLPYALTINSAESDNSQWSLVPINFTEKLYLLVPRIESEEHFQNRKPEFQTLMFDIEGLGGAWSLSGNYKTVAKNSDKIANFDPDCLIETFSAVELLKKASETDEFNSFFFNAIKEDDCDGLIKWQFENPSKSFVVNEMNEGPVIFASKHCKKAETMSLLIDVINCPMDVLGQDDNDAYMTALINGNVEMVDYFHDKQKDFVRDSQENEKNSPESAFEKFRLIQNSVAEIGTEKLERLKKCLSFYAVGFSPEFDVLAAACFKGSSETIKYLIESMGYLVLNNETNNCLILCCKYPNRGIDMLEYFHKKNPNLIKTKDSNNLDAFLHTVKSNSIEKFEKLCDLVGEDYVKAWKDDLLNRFSFEASKRKKIVEKVCVACWTDPPEHGSVFCGHVVFCGECFKEYANDFCPICKRRYVDSGMFEDVEKSADGDFKALFASLVKNLSILENPAMVAEENGGEEDESDETSSTGEESNNVDEVPAVEQSSNTELQTNPTGTVAVETNQESAGEVSNDVDEFIQSL